MSDGAEIQTGMMFRKTMTDDDAMLFVHRNLRHGVSYEKCVCPPEPSASMRPAIADSRCGAVSHQWRVFLSQMIQYALALLGGLVASGVRRERW